MFTVLLAATALAGIQPIATPPPLTMCGDTRRMEENIVSRLDFNIYGRVEWSVIQFPDQPGTLERALLLEQLRGRYDESGDRLYLAFNDGSFESCRIIGRLLNGTVGAIQCQEKKFTAALCE